MDNKKDYEDCAAAIMSIEDAAIPNIPVRYFIQEAEDLYLWCQKDKQALLKAGLNWEFVTCIPQRAGALRYVQSELLQSSDEAKTEWKERSPYAYGLRDELVHDCMYAFRNIPEVLVKVQAIAEGTGHVDMIQDLSDLSALGKTYSAPLVAIGVDMALFDVAGTLSAEMAGVLARLNGSRRGTNANIDIRNKAYTYLKQVVDEVRRCGQYVFWRNEERKVGYVSIYMKNKVAKSKGKSSDN